MNDLKISLLWAVFFNVFASTKKKDDISSHS